MRSGPLGTRTYLSRNAGKTVPLVAVIMLAAMLICSIVALMNSIPLSIRTIYRYTEESLVVGPRGDPTQTPRIVQKLNEEAPVKLDRIILCRVVSTVVHSIVGKWPFTVVGLEKDDMMYILKRQGITSWSGRLPDDGAAEAVISEPVARNLNLKIGSTLLGPDKDDGYSPHNVKVVGILHSDRWMMFTDVEYVRENHFPPLDVVLAFAPDLKQQHKLDLWADKAFKGDRAGVFTYEQLDRDTTQMFHILYKILDAVVAILVMVITIMMGMLINIHQSQRIVEFGLLQALGYTKKQLIYRVIGETTAVMALGWIFGLMASYVLLNILKRILMDPNAFALDVFDRMAYAYTIPIPFAILLVAIATVKQRFKRFDPVSVVERRLV
ncbi:MAG: ABC transporter permease [Armatimonadetes bacterium]|nr:ABC transporter permease [Armatimonadota bacterium]